MYIVVEGPESSEMTQVMVYLSEKGIIFRVAEDLSKWCVRCQSDSKAVEATLPSTSNGFTDPSKIINGQISPSNLALGNGTSQSQEHTMTEQIQPRPQHPEYPMVLPVHGLNPALHPALNPAFLPRHFMFARTGSADESHVSLKTVNDFIKADKIYSVPSSSEITSQGKVERQMPSNSRKILEEDVQEMMPSTSQAMPNGQLMATVKMDLQEDEPNSPTNAMPSDSSSLISSLFSNERNDAPVMANSIMKNENPRSTCMMCMQQMSQRNHHRKRHVLKHLGLKPYACRLCSKRFNRPDLSKPHFERQHPYTAPMPFIEHMSLEEGSAYHEMLYKCFPDLPFKPPRKRHSTTSYLTE